MYGVYLFTDLFVINTKCTKRMTQQNVKYVVDGGNFNYAQQACIINKCITIYEKVH